MFQDVSLGIGLPDPAVLPGYGARLLRRARIFVLTAAEPALNRVNDPTCRAAAEVGWRLAEGTATGAEVESARHELQRAYEASIEAARVYLVTPPEMCLLPKLVQVLGLVFTAPDGAGRELMAPEPWFAADRPIPLLTPHETQNCCWLLCDIFSHRPGAVLVGSSEWKSDWQTETAVALARQMYASGDFSAMPILADALQDAGCDNADVLRHCRGADRRPRKGAGLASNFGRHVCGCWVVDLVLGKS